MLRGIGSIYGARSCVRGSTERGLARRGRQAHANAAQSDCYCARQRVADHNLSHTTPGAPHQSAWAVLEDCVRTDTTIACAFAPRSIARQTWWPPCKKAKD